MTSDARVGGEVLGDAELIAAARGGDSAAFAALYERHAGAALVVARQYSTSGADAEDVVSEAFTKVFSVFQYGGGPDVAFRAYLFTVVRRLAMTRKDGLRRVAPTDDVETFESGLGVAASTEEPAMAGFERNVVSRAYATLPERWQAVLWYTEVESLTPAQIAPLLGLTANGVAALSYRAREGLRQAYLQEHLQAPPTDACRPCADKLGAYVRGGLARRETAQVQEHLESCEDCRALLLELGDVNHGMRTVIAPLVLGLAGLSALAKGLPLAGGLSAGAGAAGQGAAGGGAAGGAAAEGGTVAAGTASGGAAASAAASTGSLVGAGVAATGAGALGVAASGGAGSGGIAAGTAASVGATAGAAASSGGILAFLGSLSGGAIAAVLAGVIVVGGLVTAGVLGLLPGTGGTAHVSSAGAPSAGAVAPGATPPAGATVAEPVPTEQPTTPATSAPPAASTVPVTGTTTTTTTTTTPTTPTTTAPTTSPTQDPVLTPASITVVSSQLAVELSAGSSTSVSIGLQNGGQSTATDLVAVLTLPPGVSPASGAQGAVIAGGVGQSVRVGTLPTMGWTCTTTTAHSITCRLPELAGGAVTHLTVTLEVVKTASGDGTVVLDLSGSGITPTRLNVPAHVASMPAVLMVTDPSVDEVTAAEPHPLTWTVSNVGGQTATALSLALSIPDGLTLDAAGAGAAGWTCVPDQGPVIGGAAALTCSYPSLAPDTVTPALTLTAVADTRVLAAQSPTLRVGRALTWTGSSAPALGDAVLAVAPSPGELAVTAPSAASFAVGVPTSVRLTVQHVSGPELHGIDVVITPPAGVGLDPSAAQPTGWTCTAGSDGTIDCRRPTLEVGASLDLTPTLVATEAALQHPTGVLTAVAFRDGTLASSTAATVTTTQHPAPAPMLAFGSPAPLAALSAGRSGTVTFTVANTGNAVASHVVADVVLPSGIDLDTSRVGTTPCTTTGTATATVTCALGDLAAGAEVPVEIGLTSSAAGVTDLLLSIRADGLDPVEQHLAASIADGGLAPRYTSSEASAVTEIGAPLLTCAPSDTCTDILDGTRSGNNNNLTMVPLNAAGGTQTSSSSTLTIPAGRTVTFAGLYWSANAGPAQTFGAPLTSARLRGPGDTGYRDVSGTVVAQVTDSGNRSYYQSFADVTSQVAAAGSGTWSVADIALPVGATDPSPTYYAGWALVVVYSGGTGDVTVYDGGAWVASNSSVPFAFRGLAQQPVRLGVVAWEGDQGTSGDRLSLNGTALAPLRWNPSTGATSLGAADNAFDSTAVGSTDVNSLGVDVKGFAPATLTAGVNTVVASTSGDQYLIGALTVTTGHQG